MIKCWLSHLPIGMPKMAKAEAEYISRNYFGVHVGYNVQFSDHGENVF